MAWRDVRGFVLVRHAVPYSGLFSVGVTTFAKEGISYVAVSAIHTTDIFTSRRGHRADGDQRIRAGRYLLRRDHAGRQVRHPVGAW